MPLELMFFKHWDFPPSICSSGSLTLALPHPQMEARCWGALRMASLSPLHGAPGLFGILMWKRLHSRWRCWNLSVTLSSLWRCCLARRLLYIRSTREYFATCLPLPTIYEVKPTAQLLPVGERSACICVCSSVSVINKPLLNKIIIRKQNNIVSCKTKPLCCIWQDICTSVLCFRFLIFQCFENE